MTAKVAELIRALPTRMRLGSDEYTVEKIPIPEHERSWGMLNSHSHVISIEANPANAKRLAKTVLHEALHGVWADRDILPAELEERIVDQFSAGMIDMWCDNPWMLRWLAKALDQ